MVIDMRKVLKCLLGIVEVIIIVYAVSITTLLLSKNKFGYTQLGNNILVMINEDNKENLTRFTKGDLAVISKVNYNDVNVGDELYYFVTENDEYIIKAGIVASKNGDKASAIYTFEENKELTIASERVIGSFSGHSYASIGGMLSFMESRIGFLITVILPIMVLFIYQVYNLIIGLKDDKKNN